ncbi:hypothetical protein ABIE78_000518 [Sinorhizobium fredii]
MRRVPPVTAFTVDASFSNDAPLPGVEVVP